jgi:cephalosporin-C deacetylase-like acetyl esterase
MTEPARCSLAFGHALNAFQDVARQWQDAVAGHLDAAVAGAEAARHQVQTETEARAYCRRVRAKWLRFQGGLPGDPLVQRDGRYETRGELVHLGVRITKLTYESLSAVPVAGLLYQLDESEAPGGRGPDSGKRPGIVFLCGHQGSAKRVAEVQRVCLDLALHGMVVLAIDPWGQGERHEYPAPTGRPLVPAGTFEHSYGGLRCLLTGGGVGRYFAWDAVRAVDVLAALPQVDATRIGATGNSGGGVQTTLLMLADPRLAAAMPCTYITDMRAFFRTGQTLDAELSFPGTPAAGLDHADLLAAFAPRPLTVGGAAYDYFPIEGADYTFREAQRLYALQGAGGRINLFVAQAVHSYGDQMREAAVRFFTRELAGAERYERRELPTLPEDALRCSPTGQLYRDRPGQRGIYELNREFYAAHRRTPPASAGDAAERLARALGPMPDLDATPIRPRYFEPGSWPVVASADVTPGYAVQQVFFWSEPRVAVAGALLRPTSPPAPGMRPWLALLPDGTTSSDEALAEAISLARGGALVFVFDPRGRGAVRSVPINVLGLYDSFQGEEDWLNYVEIMSGHSALASRVYDVRRAVSFLEQFEGATDGVAVRGYGVGALWGYLAGALDQRIRAAHLSGMLPSWEAVVETRLFDTETVTAAMALPGVLQDLDLPDLRQCFDGRELVLDEPLRVAALPEQLPLWDHRSRLPRPSPS